MKWELEEKKNKKQNEGRWADKAAEYFTPGMYK